MCRYMVIQKNDARIPRSRTLFIIVFICRVKLRVIIYHMISSYRVIYIILYIENLKTGCNCIKTKETNYTYNEKRRDKKEGKQEIA